MDKDGFDDFKVVINQRKSQTTPSCQLINKFTFSYTNSSSLSFYSINNSNYSIESCFN